MESQGYHRKLAAILCADVAGYSRLMRDDETATVKTLESYKLIIFNLVKQHRGRVVDAPGDNLLAEFASVVDAVQCAVATQKELQAQNADLPENRRMLFRIGVNLGDVIEEDSRIYGDGVNIAARLESLSDPGGICISKTAFDQIESKLPFGYAYIGEQKIKNIIKPIGAYKVLMEPQRKPLKNRLALRGGRTLVIAGAAAMLLIIGAAVWNFNLRAPSIEPASKEKMAFPLPDKPSIAVLPFANKSEDTKMDPFCDGVTTNIITALSKVPQIMVIARASTRAYKGNQVEVKRVSESLGVQYILEGSVQKSGDRIRITVHLIDALKGITEWAETFDRDLTDTFALQDEIAIKVLTSLRTELAQTDFQPSTMQKYFKGKQGLDCYLNLMEAAEYIQRWNIEDNNRGGRLAEGALAMCPENPWGYRLLGWYYHHAYSLGDKISRQEAIEKSMELAQKAINLDASLSDPHSLMCSCYLIMGEQEKALAECERGVSLNPGSMDALSEYGHSLTYAGRYQEAIPIFQKAIRINPMGKSSLYRGIGVALLCDGQLEEAVSAFKTALQRSPRDINAHVLLTAAYIMLGRDKEAAFMAAEVLKLNPRYSLEGRFSGLKDQEKRGAFINALRKAGLPDKAPAAQP